jgi:hypothetical protein
LWPINVKCFKLLYKVHRVFKVGWNKLKEGIQFLIELSTKSM